MLYDALLALDLPSRLGPPLPTPFARGLENLIFEGHWDERRAECELSGAAALARCMEALRACGFHGLALRDEAGELLAPEAWSAEPGAWLPEALPPAWTEQPCGFALHASRAGGGICAALSLRYTPRFEPVQGALSGALRALWDLAPLAGQEAAFRASLDRTLEDETELRELARRVEGRGDALCEALLAGLTAAFEGATGARWGRVIALHGYREQPERFADLLAGIPEDRRLQLALLQERVARSPRRWPALDPGGVPGWLGRGSFVPSAEQTHVA